MKFTDKWFTACQYRNGFQLHNVLKQIKALNHFWGKTELQSWNTFLCTCGHITHFIRYLWFGKLRKGDRLQVNYCIHRLSLKHLRTHTNQLHQILKIWEKKVIIMTPLINFHCFWWSVHCFNTKIILTFNINSARLHFLN